MNSKNCDSSQATSCYLSAFPLCFDVFRHQTNGTRFFFDVFCAHRFWDQNCFAESILELVGMEMEELGRPGLAAGAQIWDVIQSLPSFFFQTNMMLGNNG